MNLPVGSHVALWPAVHVRGALESSVSLALLHHWGLCVGHARRKQGALWCAGTSKACVCLLAHTCGGRITTGQPHWTCRHSALHQCTDWRSAVNVTVAFHVIYKTCHITRNILRHNCREWVSVTEDNPLLLAFRIIDKQLIFPTCMSTVNRQKSRRWGDQEMS